MVEMMMSGTDIKKVLGFNIVETTSLEKVIMMTKPSKSTLIASRKMLKLFGLLLTFIRGEINLTMLKERTQDWWTPLLPKNSASSTCPEILTTSATV
jgi:hypothetical protein